MKREREREEERKQQARKLTDDAGRKKRDLSRDFRHHLIGSRAILPSYANFTNRLRVENRSGSSKSRLFMWSRLARRKLSCCRHSVGSGETRQKCRRSVVWDQEGVKISNFRKIELKLSDLSRSPQVYDNLDK